MTVGVINNWVDLDVRGRLDVAELTVGGVPVVGGGAVPASALTGTILAPGVVDSSLTTIGALTKLVIAAGNVPASASSAGTPGTISWDSAYLYVCTAPTTWLRVSITTW